jgi:hypothetical protein
MSDKAGRVGSQRAFVAVTLITVLAVTTVFVVYAVILSTITGNNVNVIGSGGQMWYDEANSADPADWTADLPNRGSNGTYCDPWYSKINITSAGYSGSVTITWTLQYDNSGTWTDVGGGASQVTSTSLTGSAGQTIYASGDGSQGSNKNWGLYSLTVGETYRVRAVIETA